MVLLSLLTPLLLAGAPADAGTARPTALVKLQQRLAQTQSLEADFTQKRHWAALQDTLVSEGTIRYSKSGPLRWLTRTPAESELTLDGNTATLSFPALGTSQRFDLSAEPGMAKVFESITAVLQADLERLEPLYEVSVSTASPLSIQLTPRSPELAKVISRIELRFDRALNLSQVRLSEGGGDSTEISFHGHVVKTGPR